MPAGKEKFLIFFEETVMQVSKYRLKRMIRIVDMMRIIRFSLYFPTCMVSSPKKIQKILLFCRYESLYYPYPVIIYTQTK